MHKPRAWSAAFESISMFKLMKLYKRTAVEFKTSKFTFVLFRKLDGRLVAKSLNRSIANLM